MNEEHNIITITNARIHNLKNVTVTIPKRKLTVITGVSGSGKSSLAFDTLYEEGKRVISEDYIRQAVAASECNDGYGYLWWRGEGWYGCRGFGGQSITVVPGQKTVVVTQASPTARGMGYFDLVEYCLGL